ncbi:MAG: 1-acyl-sn-glycerol-3-phosphate acyltransferase [Candidatus Heimdallarchaeota archaeon]|nr:1-acyl-sn-glycerol-3-phosphate acyltransferase [Candidatus Heimdallarchaeota archaeon]
MLRSNESKSQYVAGSNETPVIRVPSKIEIQKPERKKTKKKGRSTQEIVDNFNYNYPTNYFWFQLLGPLARFLLRIGWKIEYQGTENIPRDQNYIIMPNHVSHLDAPLAVVAIWPRKMVNVIADAKLYSNKLFRLLARMFNAFPVAKESKNTGIVDYAIKRVRNGDNFLWFPEGQRHKSPWDNKCNPGKLGSGMIAHQVDAAILPVFIGGAEFAMPVGKTLRIGKGYRSIKILVKYGKPVYLDDLRKLPPSKDTSKLVVDRIIEDIEKLRPKTYRDQSHR